MKLKQFDKTNTASQSRESNMPFIYCNAKSGMFHMNIAGQNLMKLSDGDQVIFHQSEEEPADWFIEKVKENGFTVREKGAVGEKGIVFNSTAITRKIFDSVSYIKSGGRVLIGEPIKYEKRTLFTLVTARLIND